MLRHLIYISTFLILIFQNLISYEVTIASMFRNCAPYIKEWVTYHHMIGVDHFWLYDDESNDSWEEELREFIDQGIVEVFHWPAGKPDWRASQNEAFKDGILRAIGTSKWIALMDQDEFILPLKGKSLPECLNTYFKDADAVYMNWRHFGTSHVALSFGQPMLTNLIYSSMRTHSANSIGKSILRPECVEVEQLWTQHFCNLKPGFKYLNGDAKSTLLFRGTDLVTDGFTHDKYIRVNHYAHRDENYFFNYRFPRDGNPTLMLEHYESFNLIKEQTIVEFIKKYYPSMYSSFWLNR